MRKTLVLLAVCIVLALLLFLFIIFSGGKTPARTQPVLNPSTGVRVVPTVTYENPNAAYSPGSGTGSQPPFPYNYPGNYATQETGQVIYPTQGSSGSRASVRYQNPFAFSFGNSSQPTITQVLKNLITPIVATTTRRDGVTTPRAADMWPSRGDGIIRGGGNSGGGGRPDYEFDPATGNARIGDYNFSFAVGTIADANTTNNIGDPDNLVFGTVIGSLIGSIVGMPDIGLVLGTGIGSNLFPGYRLSDFGVTVQNGMPTFDGIRPGVLGAGGSGDISGLTGGLGGSGGGSCLSGGAGGAAGGAVGGSTGSSIGGAAAGGGAYQGGMVISIYCTCSTEGDFWWTITQPTQYAGTYLYKPLSSTLFENYMFVGTFNNVGSHSSEEASCSMYAGEDCIDIPMECGELNGSPGTGTSLTI